LLWSFLLRQKTLRSDQKGFVDDTLVVFAESSAWSARLRYAVVEIEAQIRAAHPGITEITVRVLPKI